MTLGNTIPCFSWTNKKIEPQAVLLCVHGLCLHGGTYKPFGEVMASRQIATYAVDIRGFGAWRHSDLNFPACLKDIRWKIDELRSLHQGLPVFLLGESLGGAISTRYAAEYGDSIDGLILCAPASTLSDYKWEVLWTAMRFLSSPGRRVCLRDSVFRHSPNLVALGSLDPKVRTEFTPSELWHLAAFLRRTSEHLAKIHNTPILFIQGHRDLLVKPSSTVRLFERLPVADKDLVIIGAAQHLIFQSSTVPLKAACLVENWIRDHLPDRSIQQVA